MSGHPGVEWLRSQITARLEVARRADTGETWEAELHYDGLWLVDLTPGAGPLEDVDALRDASIPLPDASTFETPRFLWAFAPHARHIAANDPRDVIARCESELATLGAYVAAVKRERDEDADFAQWVEGGAPAERPVFQGPSPRTIPGLALAVQNIASGYRHRPGYAEHWGNVSPRE